MRTATLSVILAMTMSACGGPGPARVVTGEPSQPEPGDIEAPWQLEEGRHNGEDIPIVDSHPITMTIDGDQMGGTAGCNHYGARFELSGEVISIDLIAVTEMACHPAEVMQSEQRFLEALGAAEKAELTADELVLSGPVTGLVFTRLEPVPTADLIGTVWVLEGLVQGDVVTSPMTEAEPATLQLFGDGTFTGFTGCRTISGAYQTFGAVVQFTDWGAEGECSAELREQDGRVISALEGGFRVEIEEDRMTTWVAGDEGLVYRARP